MPIGFRDRLEAVLTWANAAFRHSSTAAFRLKPERCSWFRVERAINRPVLGGNLPPMFGTPALQIVW